MATEFSLIDAIARRASTRGDVVLGIGDDAAIVAVPAGHQLVVAMDTLNAGVHFPEGTAPADIGWKALAVNLSDLAAMGARPAWCTLSLSLPDSDIGRVDGFLDGFLSLAALHGVALVGGDTTRGPLSVCVTAHGLVEPGRALRRDGARVGDDVWVTGTPGDAAGALAQWRAGGERDAALRARLDRPTPRVEAGPALVADAGGCVRSRAATRPAVHRWRRLRAVLHACARAARRYGRCRRSGRRRDDAHRPHRGGRCGGGAGRRWPALDAAASRLRAFRG